MLYVTMEPQPGLSLDQFHDWYNNEHGPTRLRLPHIFRNGLRYRATDGRAPRFLAAYDVERMAHLDTETYTALRAHRSPRETATIAQVDVTRYYFDLVEETRGPLFRPPEQHTDAEADGAVLVSIELMTKEGVEGAEEEVLRWYGEEHVPLLSKVPGWLRTRCFRTSALEDADGKTKLLALHEYTKENGLGGAEPKASMSTKRRVDALEKYVSSIDRRTHELFYIFGPAPRDLGALSRLPAQAAWTSPDGQTQTIPGPDGAVITSYVTTADGLAIPYRIEGNPSPAAPVIAFSNSLLTSLHMWDGLVALLRRHRPELRLLRLETRGRRAVPSPPAPATLAMLADDLAAVLAALRVPRLHALVGVSMGGATALRFALRYPAWLERFVACDFNVASSEANTRAWKERIALAEEEGGTERLAQITVERWVHPSTLATKEEVVDNMVTMVGENDVRGFKFGCQALWVYDMQSELPKCTVPGLLVVGEADGKGTLVKAMEAFKELVGPEGTELRIVPEAGHLPMVENPDGFWDAVGAFL